MSNNRDDFSEKTKRTAAMRVGYRCSFQPCGKPTVGASLEDKNKAPSIGVAAHICAAAPGGPRYDPNMTEEERKDISNCIWMCQTHAHLIDTDEERYPVDLLRKWKSEAEQFASDALADPNFIINCYETDSDNFDSIYQIFNYMITEGNYEKLRLLLDQYRIGQLSEKYDEFVLRFRIIYDAYCNRTSLKNDISQYLSLANKYGIDELMELFIALIMKQELKQLITCCENSNLKRIATIIIEDRAETDLLYSCEGKCSHPQIPEKYNELIFKAATNDIALNIKTNIKVKGQQQVHCEGLYTQEFYFHVIAAMYSIIKRDINNIALNMYNDRELIFILEHIEKINQLDFEIKEQIWSDLLRFLTKDRELFQKYYSLCPDKLKEYDSIKKSKIIYLAQHEPQNFSIDETVSLAERTNDYSLLTMVFNYLDNNLVIKFLDNHRYLLSKSCKVLFHRIFVCNHLSDDKLTSLLDEYSDTYKDDFLYHCLRAKYCKNETENELSWLNKNILELSSENVRFYCLILNQHKQWKQLYEISKLSLPINILCGIAESLANSQINIYLERSKKIFENALEKGYQRQGLKNNLGVVNQDLGYTESAKKYFKEEYDEYHTLSSLRDLISIRFQTNDFIEDSYLLELSKDIDASSQNLVGATYLKLQDYQNALKFYIRSLLLDDKIEESYNGICSINLFYSKPVESHNTIKEKTVCMLSNGQNTIQVAIHSPDYLENISPNQFADCKHYSIEDTNITNLLYRSSGETVCFEGTEYTIKDISSTSDVFFRYAFCHMTKQPHVIKICGPVDDTIKQINSVLRDVKEETDKIIVSYNQANLRIPISILSKQVRKKMLDICEFLALNNTEEIRNNLNHIEEYQQKPIFILSYDSIVFLSHLNINLSFLNGYDLVCSSTVEKHLSSDITDDINNLSSDKRRGSLYYSEEKPLLIKRTPELKRNRHTYLNNLRNLLKQIRVIDNSYDYVPQNTTFKESFAKLILENKLLCEGSCLGLAQNLPGSILVTDDQIIYDIASAENISNIGLVSLLTYAASDWKDLLEISKSLHRINFINYLPVFLYKKMVDCVSEDTESSAEEVQKIIAWLSSDTDNTPSILHENIVIGLFKDVLNIKDLQNLFLNDALGAIAVKAFLRQNPNYIAKQLDGFMEELKNGSIEPIDEIDYN